MGPVSFHEQEGSMECPGGMMKAMRRTRQVELQAGFTTLRNLSDAEALKVVAGTSTGFNTNALHAKTVRR
jgi:hypothetical protein